MDAKGLLASAMAYFACLRCFIHDWTANLMRGGNLSNELALGIGVRFERIIKTDEGKRNRAAAAYLNKLLSMDFRVVIITFDRRKCLSFLTKWKIPYSEVVEVDSNYEIADICVAHQLITYFDVDPDVLQGVNSRASHVTRAEIWETYEVV